MASFLFYIRHHLVLFGLLLLVLLPPPLDALIDPLAMPSWSELSPSLSDEPPVPSPPVTVDHWDQVDEAIAQHWPDRSGFEVDVDACDASDSMEEWQACLAKDGEASEETEALTYGEVTALGARQLAAHLFVGRSKRDVFADLGSGVGKLAVQLWLESPNVVESIGIELNVERHERGVASLAALVSSGDALALRRAIDHTAVVGGVDVRLANGDILEEGMVAAMHNVSHVFVAGLCFPDAVLRGLAAVLAGLPQLEAVASLKAIPFDEEGSPGGDGEETYGRRGGEGGRKRDDRIERGLREWAAVTPVEVEMDMSWAPAVVKIYRRARRR
jgi:hypothetical protein